MSAFPSPRLVQLAGRRGVLGTEIPPIRLAVHEAGSGPAVVMCHGFPELAYSWRHQVAALGAQGFRAIAADQRGYGASDCPEAVEDYDLEHLTSDMAGMLDELGIEKAVFAGHDWGGFVAWAMPVLYPERTLGAIGVNTPNFPFPKTERYRARVDHDDKDYILWFQKPGVAEEFLDSHRAQRRLGRGDSGVLRHAAGHSLASRLRAGLVPPGVRAAAGRDGRRVLRRDPGHSPVDDIEPPQPGRAVLHARPVSALRQARRRPAHAGVGRSRRDVRPPPRFVLLRPDDGGDHAAG